MVVTQRKWKRLAGQMLVGAAIGAGTTGLVLTAWDGRGLDISDTSQMLAVVAGLIYALIGLIVAVGALAPNTGAKLLNVEDAAELIEERPRLGPSAIMCILIGLFLLAMAAGEPASSQALLSPVVAAVVAAACFAGIVLIGRIANKRTDEFSRQLSVEATATAMYVVAIAAAAWAMLSLFDIEIAIRPLGILAILAMLELCAIFAVCGKRGLLMPRG